MIKSAKLFIILLFSLSTSVVFANTPSSTILFGIESHDKKAEAPTTEWRPIVQVIENVTEKIVKIKNYYYPPFLIEALKSQKVSIAFLKASTAEKEDLSSKNIIKLATAATKDPLTGETKTTYSRVLLVAKNSSIENIDGLENKKIAYYNAFSMSNFISVKNSLSNKGIHANWYKVSSLNAALDAVLKHKADAVGIWDYLYVTSVDKSKFKIIETINGLKNPGLYINTKQISATQQEELKKQLSHVKGPYNIVGFK